MLYENDEVVVLKKIAMKALKDIKAGVKLVDTERFEQGFVTMDGRFVGRREGYEIALRNGQILDPSQAHPGCLYSEDLY